MKRQMKLIFRAVTVLIGVSILILTCKKEGDISHKIDKIPEAFPDINGETVSVILGEDTLNCNIINERYIFQGDIIIDKSQLNKTISGKGAGLVSLLTRWPEDRVYFTINDDYPNKEKIIAAIGEYQAKTHLKFVTRTNEPNYVEFIGLDYDGAYSNLGMIGGRQEIGIGNNYPTGGIIHEIGHTIGLIHEQSRSDRDNYITIHFDNIQPSKWDQFAKVTGTINLSDFDFNSIMMYGSYTGFELIADKPSITNKDGSIFSVIWENLSTYDVRSINKIYISDGIVSDIDDNVYKTVRIGEQWWMAENLKTSRYNKGDAIITGLNDSDWSNTSSGAYAIQNNDIVNNNIYGKLYNWYAVTDNRQLCPKYWHVPSDADWRQMIFFIDPNPLSDPNLGVPWLSNIAGGKLKEVGTAHWNPFNLDGSPSNTDATDIFGFTALPGGNRSQLGPYYFLGSYGLFWSSTTYNQDPTRAWFYNLVCSGPTFYPYYFSKNFGYSVRCIRD
jgi:uncharacterized protein (TIGR02145 family)